MNLLHACGRVGIALAATVWLSAAAAQVEQDTQAPDYVLEKIRYAADHCLQLRRWRDEEQTPTDADDAQAMIAAGAAASVDHEKVAGTAADAGVDTEEGAQDDDAPELLLSSRFNGEACEARDDGAVIDDKADLPIVLDALRAVHEALTVAPEWIDEDTLPLDVQGCWRRGARLEGVAVDRHENQIQLYLQGNDCSGTGRYLVLRLPLVSSPVAGGDSRRENAIVAEERILAICGTGLLDAE